MHIDLKPLPNIRLRLIVLAVLLIPIFFASRMNLVWMLLSCVLPLALTGTYRTAQVEGDWLRTQFHFAFVPLKPERCKLPAVVYIDTKYNQGTGWGTLVLFGPLQYIFGFIFDWLIPALGGAYEIYVITAKGRELCAWQGNSQADYEANLELLRNHSGAEIRLRS